MFVSLQPKGTVAFAHDEPLAHQGFSEELVMLVRAMDFMDFSLPVLSLSVQVTLLVSQHKDHSRRGHNAAAAITLSPLKAEGNRVRGKVNAAFAVPYQGSCHQCRAFWCTCLRTRLPFFKSP